MTGPFRRTGKQVLDCNWHFADACSEAAAQQIVDAMNAAQASAQKIIDIAIAMNRGVAPMQPGDEFTIDVDGKRYGGTVPTHRIERQGDEYACSCGLRWDIVDGEEHP